MVQVHCSAYILVITHVYHAVNPSCPNHLLIIHNMQYSGNMKECARELYMDLLLCLNVICWAGNFSVKAGV
jgi:hypothetical protein